MKKRSIQHHMDGLAALLLFGVFAVCVLMVLLSGADAYRRLVDRDQTAYDRRIGVQYVATRLHQADSLDYVTVEKFGDSDALLLSDNDGYVTRIYCYEGYLMELYAAKDAILEPQAGEAIMESAGLELSLTDGLLMIIIADKEGEQGIPLRLSLRSGEEGVR